MSDRREIEEVRSVTFGARVIHVTIQKQVTTFSNQATKGRNSQRPTLPRFTSLTRVGCGCRRPRRTAMSSVPHCSKVSFVVSGTPN
jgi:hypothetical protein